MTPRRTSCLTPLAIVALTLPGGSCKSKDRLAEHVNYNLVFDEAVPPGVQLYVNGKPNGAVKRDCGSSDQPCADLRLSGDDTIGEQQLTLRTPTPCGLSEPIAITASDPGALARARKARSSQTTFNVPMTLAAHDPWSEPGRFWVDPGIDMNGETDVVLGEAPLGKRSEVTRLFELGCAETHAVKIDGKTIGQLQPAASTTKLWMITATADECYIEGSMTEREEAHLAAKSLRALVGSHIYELRTPAPEKFLGQYISEGFERERQTQAIERVSVLGNPALDDLCAAAK